MDNPAKVSEQFVYRGSNGLEVVFDLSYACRKDPSLPPRFELRMSASQEEDNGDEKSFDGELEIEVHAYGQQEQRRWYADCQLKNGKPLEVQGNNWGHLFKGKGPSFWPTDHMRWKINNLTAEGYSVELPAYSLQNLRVEFSSKIYPRA